MNIRTYKKDEYRGCPIYYRNFGFHFEYLVCIKNQIYTAHITVNPNLFNRLLFWLGVEKSYYNEKEQVAIVVALRRMANTTIDFILDKKNNKQKKS